MSVASFPLKPFPQQVAGSLPLLTRDDGQVCKPATMKELSFYKDVSKSYPSFAAFVPKFMGQVSVGQQEISSLPRTDSAELKSCDFSKRFKKTPWSYTKLIRSLEDKRSRKVVRENVEKDSLVFLVLENLTNKLPFPHILDLKIGTQQHSNFESSAKKQSKSFKCMTTTSASTGLRLAGIQMFDRFGNQCRKDKYWGRSLTESALRRVLTEFVSVVDRCSDDVSSGEMCSKFEVRTTVVKQLIDQIDELVKVVKSLNWRFFGCSALITFSGGPVADSQAQPKSCSGSGAVIRIIDFANVELEGYKGYDEGFVTGLMTLREIFQNTITRKK